MLPIPVGLGFPLAASSTLNFNQLAGGGIHDTTSLTQEKPQETSLPVIQNVVYPYANFFLKDSPLSQPVNHNRTSIIKIQPQTSEYPIISLFPNRMHNSERNVRPQNSTTIERGQKLQASNILFNDPGKHQDKLHCWKGNTIERKKAHNARKDNILSLSPPHEVSIYLNSLRQNTPPEIICSRDFPINCQSAKDLSHKEEPIPTRHAS